MRTPALIVALCLTLIVPASAASPQAPQVPAGFAPNLFAAGLGKVRFLAVHPTTGVMFASVTDVGNIIALPDANQDGVADKVVIFAKGIPKAHGLTWHDNALWVAGTDRVVTLRDDNNDLVADGPPVQIATLPAGGGHFTRTLRFAPDGRLIVSIGSTCNVCEEQNPERASLIVMNADGSGRQLYATGLRNAVGITFDSSGQLWATNNGRDQLGNELPPEGLYHVTEGGFYGWPYAYGNKVPDPDWGKVHPEKVAATIAPAWEFPAHTAPLGLNFYTGSKWPAAYRDDLFVGFHGSWNSTYKKGYNVLRVDFEGGQPVRSEVFVSGFLQSKDKVWGRPVDIITGSDGQMYLTDDYGGRIWRIAYSG